MKPVRTPNGRAYRKIVENHGLARSNVDEPVTTLYTNKNEVLATLPQEVETLATLIGYFRLFSISRYATLGEVL